MEKNEVSEAAEEIRKLTIKLERTNNTLEHFSKANKMKVSIESNEFEDWISNSPDYDERLSDRSVAIIKQIVIEDLKIYRLELIAKIKEKSDLFTKMEIK